MGKVRILTPKDTFTIDYFQAEDFREKQGSVFWTAEEIKVEKDKQDILVNMTESERHGVITTLKLFSKYEMIIGDEFWQNYVSVKFPRPEIKSMAALFTGIELAVHLPFYKKLNEEIGIATDEFYDSYISDPELKQRIDHLESILNGNDELRVLGQFTFGEGAVLYSSFAYLKHFQSKGKNKLKHVVSGINFSARDENLHCEAAAWLFRTLMQELKDAKQIDDKYLVNLEKDIISSAEIILEHETIIINKIFEMGEIENITAKQLINFCKSRINYCLKQLGYKNLYQIDYNPIAEWFYDGINGYQMIDFFSSKGNQYQRDWSEEDFKQWKQIVD